MRGVGTRRSINASHLQPRKDSDLATLFLLTRCGPFIDSGIILWRRFRKLFIDGAADTSSAELMKPEMSYGDCEFVYKSTGCESAIRLSIQ